MVIGLDRFRPITAVRPPPGFTPFSYLSYDELFLPRPEFEKFNGNPLEFKTFLTSFETYIEPRVHDKKMLFCLLLQHCEDKVRLKIEHFGERDEQAYELAKERLKREFGRSCIIADLCEQQLKDAPQVKSNDSASLKSYSELLEKTLSTLQNMHYLGSFNSLDCMTKLVNKLPFDMRKRWVRESVKIEEQFDRVAMFEDLVKFVTRESEEQNSLFGRRVFSNKIDNASVNMRGANDHHKGVINAKSKSIFSASTNLKKGEKTQSRCWFCDDCGHVLHNCPKFKELTLNEKLRFVKRKQLCYKCLSSRHRTSACKVIKTCTVPGCTGTYHNTLLHKFKPAEGLAQLQVEPLSTGDKHSPARVPETNSSETSVVACSHISDGVYLCVVPVKVHCKGKTVRTYAFLDQGSTHSFCDDKLIRALGVSGQEENMTLQTLCNPSVTCRGVTLSLDVSSLDGIQSISLTKVFSIKNIPVSPNAIPAKGALNKMPHLHDIEFQKIPGATVTLLIGADVPEAFCPIDIRRGNRGQPIAVETPLGWSLLGPSLSSARSSNCSVNFVTRCDSGIERLVQTLWSTDFGDGISVFDQPYSREDKTMFNLLETSVKMTNGHYQLPLPWQPGITELPNNKEMAFRRLLSLKGRLAKDNELRTKYAQTMQSYLTTNYASEIAENEQVQNESPLSWYLPHHPVIHPLKNKVRVVFDCSAKYKGVSLNDSLMSGPSLTNSLVGVLIRFRKEPVALIGDIHAMFHQVLVKPEHRNSLKFLWWPEGDLNKQPTTHQMNVHLFGATSSPCCASYCLRQVVTDFGNKHLPITSEIIKCNFYVDDCLMSFHSPKQVIEIMQDLIQLLKRGGFHLTKWLTNNQQVLSAIPQQERAGELQTHDLEATHSHRVLGVQWDSKSDEFLFKVNLPNKSLTRRGLLSAVSSLYDPLGFVSPVTLMPKLLLQNLCKKRYDWDKPLKADEVTNWHKWLETLPALSNLHIQRCFRPLEFGEIRGHEIHIFSDASLHCYGSCCYLRLMNNQGQIHCAYVIGKARVAPIKAISIPKLKLTAAVLSVKLWQLVKKELVFLNCPAIFWTDSTAVLQIIQNSTKRFSVFAANRLAIINEHTQAAAWRYEPSKLNPADFATRGISADQLIASHPWLHGPQFLWCPETQWPQDPVKTDEFQSEMIKTQPHEASVSAVKVTSPFTKGSLNPLDRLIEQSSSLFKLKKLTSWLQRGKQFLRERSNGNIVKFNMTPLSVNELQRAELELLKNVQRKYFSYLFSGSSSASLKIGLLPRFMKKLHPVILDGVIRVGGRLERANVEVDLKHPILLPDNCHFTELVIRQYHCEVGHSGTSQTWAAIRQKYWIVKGGIAVRRTIGHCTICKRRNARVEKQFMTDLPSPRLQKIYSTVLNGSWVVLPTHTPIKRVG